MFIRLATGHNGHRQDSWEVNTNNGWTFVLPICALTPLWGGVMRRNLWHDETQKFGQTKFEKSLKWVETSIHTINDITGDLQFDWFEFGQTSKSVVD